MNRLISFLTILALLSISGSVLAVEEQPTEVQCPTVTLQLSPCLDYIKSKADAPPPACCSGVKDISSKVQSPMDRSSVCSCLQKTLGNIGPYDKNRIPLIPRTCGVSINLPPIDSKTDCSKAKSKMKAKFKFFNLNGGLTMNMAFNFSGGKGRLKLKNKSFPKKLDIM
ncbi:hypothetical protein QYF36_001648 [Acer negundo]|nr:hypothetical protein QYF36_001648 [Acer negundo]